MKPFDPNLYNEDDSAKDVFIDWHQCLAHQFHKPTH